MNAADGMLSGFTLVRHGTKFDYPYLESLRSMLPLVDELVINVGKGSDSADDTLKRIKLFSETEGQGKMKFFESDWNLDDPAKKKGGMILSEQTNLALEKCSADWCIYLQADEVLHEEDLPRIREALLRARRRPEIEGLLFDYVHFYGSYEVVQISRSVYRREVRVIRRSSGARSIGDAQSFRKLSKTPGIPGEKLQVIHCGAKIFHYGWVRTPESMREKTYFMDQLYHGKPKDEAAAKGIPHTGDNYRYKRILGLRTFEGSHPQCMTDRIKKKGWHWDLNNSPLEWTWKDGKKLVFDKLELLTGVRLFEYRSYKRVSDKQLDQLSRDIILSHLESAVPKATLFVATYEQPHQLALVCAGLERQSASDFEIIFCDDGSGDETAEIIQKFKASVGISVQHLWQKHRGFRKCRILNEALRKSRGQILIFLDGDCIPHRDFVHDHLKEQELGRYLAGRRVELGEVFSNSITPQMVRSGFFDRLSFPLLASSWRGDTEFVHRAIRVPWKPLRYILKMSRVTDMKGCNYSVSRQSMEAINGFDEAYEGYGREDTDVELRLQNLGLKIKSLKGLAIQFHVWHPRRVFTEKNDVRLEDLKTSGRIRCELGYQ